MVLSFQSHVYIYIALSYLYSFILWGIKEIMIVFIMIIIIMIIIILLIDYWREIKYWWTPIFLFFHWNIIILRHFNCFEI